MKATAKNPPMPSEFYVHEDHKKLVPKLDAIIKEMKASGELELLIKSAETQVVQ